MFVKELIAKNEQWKKRCEYYKGIDAKLQNGLVNEKANNQKEQQSCVAQISALNAKISANERDIQAFYQETYQHYAYAQVEAVVTNFGVTTKTSDRSVDIQQKTNALKSNLQSKKALEAKLAQLKQQAQGLDAIYAQKIAENKQKFVLEKKALTDQLLPEYEKRKNACPVAYDDSTQIPKDAASIPDTITLGKKKISVPYLASVLSTDSAIVPYEVDVKNAGNIIINIKQEDLYAGNLLERNVVGLMLRYLTAFPASSLHFGMYCSMIASASWMNNFYLAAKDAKAAIMPEPISSGMELKNLLDQIATSAKGPSEKMLTNNCRTLYDLYTSVPDNGEPFHLIVLYNALADINKENLQRLSSLISGNHRYGMRFIIVDDLSAKHLQKEELALPLKAIEQSCEKIEYNSGKPTLNGVPTAFGLLNESFDSNLAYNFCKLYFKNKASKTSVSFEDIHFGQEQKDPTNYNGISIPIGKYGAKIWSIGFASVFDAQNPYPIANLLLGVPGTGKTSIIEAMIYNGAIKYSPDELIFHMLDFKEGSAAHAYLIEENKIPHIKVVSAENDAEEASFILTNIIQENKERVNAFKALGAQLGTPINHIGEYNKTIDTKNLNLPKMPRLVIIVDECQTLFADDSLVAKVDEIIRKGRSQGVHLILATQEMTPNMRKAINMIDGRYIFDSKQDDVDALVAKEYRSRIKAEVPKGSFMAFATNDGGRKCEKIRPAYFGDAANARAHYAKEIRSKWTEDKYPCDVVKIGEKDKLDINTENYEKILDNAVDFRIPVGENYQNRKTSYCTTKEEKLFSSILLHGDQEPLASSLCTSVMLSAIRSGIPVHAIDTASSQNLSKLKKECFNSNQDVEVGIAIDYKAMLTKMYDLYCERAFEKEKAPDKKFSPVLFIVNGGQNISDYTNNTTIELATTQAEPQPAATPSAPIDICTTPFPGRRRMQAAAAPTPVATVNKPSKIQARTALLELVEKGREVGIGVCLWIDKNDVNSERSLLKDRCRLKVIFPAFSKHYESYLDDSFRPKMVHNVNNNMAIVECFDADGAMQLKKIRVYQYDLTQQAFIEYLKKL